MSTNPESPDLRYPIGPPPAPGPATTDQRTRWIDEIEAAPAQLRAAVEGLSNSQLDTPYREGGWTVRQVTHHVPDSHMNAFIRIKLGLAEVDPVIKPYPEHLWALLPDVEATPIETSLALLENLHSRWVLLLRAITDEQWQSCFVHPDLGKLTLEYSLSLYAWHGKHHVAHVTQLRKRTGW